MTESEALNMMQAKLICMELYDLSCIEKGCDRKCENCEYNYAKGNNGEQKEALKVAIQALEKQIPKKVRKEQWIDSKCTCGYVFSKHHGDGYYSIPYENMTPYCPKCGQKLDWSDEE